MASSSKDEDMKTFTERDVVVIGAGWSGLVSCKHMLEEKLSVAVLEKSSYIGGIWQYSEDTSITTVMRSTQTSSSSTMLEMSDHPMPENIGMFPHHTDVLEYLKSYADRFELRPHIHLNCTVTKVEKVKEVRDESSKELSGWWITECNNGDIYKSRFLVVATGIVQVPDRRLESTLLKGYSGPTYHASQVKHPLQEFRGKRLLVVGGGETGSDICMDWYDHVDTIHWSIPRGQHFFRKYGKVVPWGHALALDKASSRMMKLVTPYCQGKPGLAWLCKWTTGGSLLAYQGHGIPEWKNEAGFFKFFINKNGRVLDFVDFKKLIPKSGIKSCEGTRVTFTDGTELDFDLIIMSTGYKVEHPYLPKEYSDVKVRKLYKMLFNIEDPTICFIGLVRPIVGSIVTIAEMQSRWMAKVFADKVPIQSLEERMKERKEDDAFWNNYFKDSSQRIEGLVELFTYTDSIAQHARVYPDYWSLFKKSPSQWLTAYFAPYNGAAYRLNEKQHLDRSIETMHRHLKHIRIHHHYLLYIFMRLLWIDWWIEIIGKIKYRIQVSSWWPKMRDMRIVRWANAIWTSPKLIFFDQRSNERDEMSENARNYMKFRNN